jgi:uncharacterized protein
MDKVIFRAYGHPNMRSAHRLTFEFTKDRDLTPRGDCIIGVNSDFQLEKIRPLLRFPRLKLTIRLGGEQKTVLAKTNPDFCSDHEIVVRRGVFISGRTLGTDADLVAKDFQPWLPKLKDPNQEIIIELEGMDADPEDKTERCYQI